MRSLFLTYEMAALVETWHFGCMPDPVHARAQLAIEEARQLKDEWRALVHASEIIRSACRLAVLESAMMREELRAYRNNNG
ncbi:hypothetical protein [Bradyrhizobium sp. 18]|uniref:hypothetical protein n=1 Tax=Bradyrhizobium sp. 18 TaxID=2782657 RepID=UPI001FFB968B|nr:hypothetical protein [Bradyrhizobium sp. 18]MCK1508405.1 hypothetical protein [Bradyrhizobium sp. 18]